MKQVLQGKCTEQRQGARSTVIAALSCPYNAALKLGARLAEGTGVTFGETKVHNASLNTFKKLSTSDRVIDGG